LGSANATTISTSVKKITQMFVAGIIMRNNNKYLLPVRCYWFYGVEMAALLAIMVKARPLFRLRDLFYPWRNV